MDVACKRTIAGVVDTYGPAARERLCPRFDAAGVRYPPEAIALLGLKAERRLELWAAAPGGAPVHICDYAVLAASGGPGPKLREGDLQVPEGVYAIESLNPNSAFHLSMKLNYPNAVDLKHAEAEGRAEPGSDIFIHGRKQSIGCLAIGDEAIEELFVLVAELGIKKVTVVIAPRDPRGGPLVPGPQMPPWTRELYRTIEDAFAAFARRAVERHDV